MTTINVITGSINNLGNDLMLDESGDLITSSSGDFFTTEDSENYITNLPFRGYVSLSETIYAILTSIKGSYPFDINFGSNIGTKVSSNVTKELVSELKTIIVNELLKDDRIKSITNISIILRNQNELVIEISLLAIGQSDSSKFVFPFAV